MHIDLLIVNAGAATVGKGLLGRVIGRITNNEKDLIKLNKVYKPNYILPVHFGTFSHYQETTYIKESIGNNAMLLSPGESIDI